MPCRKTYEINNREQGKAAQRDQSYKSCLIALIIFFFMCLILILASIPWKAQNQRRYQNTEQESQYHHEGRIKETDVTVPSTIQTTTKKTTTTVKSTPKEDVDVITEDHLKKAIKGSHHNERLFKNRTDEEIFTSPTTVEDIKDYSTITTQILQYAETTEEDIGSTTLQRDTVTSDIIDHNAALTSSDGLIVNTTTLNNVTNVDFTEHISKSVKEIDEYYSSEKSEVDVTSDYITTPTLSTQSNDVEESAAGNSTNKFERLKAAVITDNITSSTMPNLFSSTKPQESTSAEYSPDNYSEKSQFDVTNNIMISTSPTRSDPEEDRNSTSSTYLNYEESTTAEYNATLIDENVTRENSFATTLLVHEEFSTPTTKNEAEDTMNASTTENYSGTTKKYNENVTFSTAEEYDASSTNNYANTATTFAFYNYTRTIVPKSYDEKNLTTTIRTTLPDEDTNVCETGHCKYIVSKMLSYMNHSADPCDDFYEYACGGFEADPQLIDADLVRRSKNYQRIASQMLKEKRENVHSDFATYYDSCVQYERSMNFSERIKMANDEFRKMGGFHTTKTWHDNHADFTNLFAELILRHSALFFDVVPELDEYRPYSFTLKIGPTTFESPFKTEYAEDPCSDDEFETKGQYVDLEVLYDNYIKCKNNMREFTRSIKEALTVLNVFKDIDDVDDVEFEYVEQTVVAINSVIMQGYFSHFPSKNEIREAYLMNNYSKVSLDELQSSGTFVNWTQLIRSLTGVDTTIKEGIQVYFHDALIKGLRTLEEFGNKNPVGLNNAIMGLYARKLYRELILPKNNNVKNYCLQVAAYLLRLEASSLYISSFADHEIAQMNDITKKIFKELKETLKSKTEEAEWAREAGRHELLKKIDSLELALPIVSFFKNRDLLYSEYNISQIILYDNYFNNSMILLKRYRILMYAELRRQVGDPKQIWTYHATPFQSKAEAIYGLNLVVIPYGIIDSSLINDELYFDYLLLATLGNLIAHQIAHHFDANGIHYWNQIRNTQDSLMYENEFTDTNFDDYINCQKENLYQGLMNMTVPYVDQTVSFMIPRLTLNERLSEIMGLRLAYDTLALTRSDTEKQLPWIKLRIDQLYYLAYAQMYCTKTPLMSSYVSLHESEDLPSRIRVFVSASNNKLLGEAWNCPLGSPTAPNDICSVFPYIDFKETVLAPQ